MLQHETLGANTAIGRFGAAYVRKICSHAHVGFVENAADEDVLAIDAEIQFAPVSTRIQIKTSTQYSLSKQSGLINMPLKSEWVAKWRDNIHPAYLVLVLLDQEVSSWTVYNDDHTFTNAYALWARVDTLPAEADHLALDRRNRFTPSTVGAWHDYLLGGYGEGSS